MCLQRKIQLWHFDFFFLNRCTDKLLTVRCIIIICYIYIVLFWVLKALHIEGGDLLNHHQCAASTWMWRQPYCTRTPTTHQLTGGEETAMTYEANQCMGMIRRPWCSEANGEIWPWCQGYICIFNDHRESGFNVSSENRQCFLTVKCPRHYTGVLGPTQTTVRAPPAGLTNTSSSSNLVSQEVSHPGTDQLNPA